MSPSLFFATVCCLTHHLLHNDLTIIFSPYLLYLQFNGTLPLSFFSTIPSTLYSFICSDLRLPQNSYKIESTKIQLPLIPTQATQQPLHQGVYILCTTMQRTNHTSKYTMDRWDRQGFHFSRSIWHSVKNTDENKTK